MLVDEVVRIHPAAGERRAVAVAERDGPPVVLPHLDLKVLLEHEAEEVEVPLEARSVLVLVVDRQELENGMIHGIEPLPVHVVQSVLERRAGPRAATNLVDVHVKEPVTLQLPAQLGLCRRVLHQRSG